MFEFCQELCIHPHRLLIFLPGFLLVRMDCSWAWRRWYLNINQLTWTTFLSSVNGPCLFHGHGHVYFMQCLFECLFHPCLFDPSDGPCLFHERDPVTASIFHNFFHYIVILIISFNYCFWLIGNSVLKQYFLYRTYVLLKPALLSVIHTVYMF